MTNSNHQVGVGWEAVTIVAIISSTAFDRIERMPSFKSLSHKIHTLGQLTSAQRGLVLEAWFRLGWARFSILAFPFRWLMPTLGELKKETPMELGEPQVAVAREIKAAIERASRYTPWASNCLTQGVVAKQLLRRRGLASTLYLGAKLDDRQGMEAHAWVRCGPIYVSGGQTRTDFGILTTFGD